MIGNDDLSFLSSSLFLSTDEFKGLPSPDKVSTGPLGHSHWYNTGTLLGYEWLYISTGPEILGSLDLPLFELRSFWFLSNDEFHSSVF
jgi:hypothetical protein